MTTEQSILSSLGITNSDEQNDIISGKTRLLILDASAHMDWDWLLPYPVLVTGGDQQRAAWYFRPAGQSSPTDPGVGPVNQILGQATGLLQSNDYHYSVCETGFLRGFAITDTATFNTMMQQALTNNNLRFAGGGITSPDNLLPHGETFIRNYLVGNTWLAAHCPGLPVPKTAWIPDDFGHDPQLPIVLQAMGLMAAGFERIPGNGSWKIPVSGATTLVTELTNNKIDFTWTAADGSSIIAHWLIGGYGQGNDISVTADIKKYLGTNFGPSPTPYIYVPVLSDFSLPNTQLLNVVNECNKAGGEYNATVVVATCGSFEDYAQLLQFHSGSLNTSYGAEFNANPFSTGCYGSRPAIKILHQRATRNLLAAEVLSIIATWAQPGGGTGTLGTGINWAQSLEEAWNLLTPSTHHDYITGTAIPDVYHTEQITLLRQADDRAQWLVQEAMETIAGAINTGYNTNPVVVFNPLGFGRNGIAEIDAAAVANTSLSISGSGYQTTANGGLLFEAKVPSLGYQTVYLGSAEAPTNPAMVKPQVPVTQQPLTMSNGLLSATLTQGANGVWNLSSVVDMTTNYELIPSGAIANEVLFYADSGDEYIFGMENPLGDSNQNTGWTLTDVSAHISHPTIEVLETGPLRVVVRTGFNYNDGQFNINYLFEYTLYANEPMLRMKATGAAPMLQAASGNYGTAVVLAFPLNSSTGQIDSLVRGTPYHWTDVMNIYWNDQTFLPTHHFVIPVAGEQNLCAIYHTDIPGWGLNNQWNKVKNVFENDATLYGCAWRNGDGHYYDWVGNSNTPLTNGTDPDVHVHSYALRIPSGLQAAATGQPLQEAIAFASPLKALPVAPWTGALDTQASLATSSNSQAIITAAKMGTVNPDDIIFRIYQATNQTITTTITLSDKLTKNVKGNVVADGVTALEQALTEAQQTAMNLSTDSSSVTITMPQALATVAVTPSS
jgi:alpha-mannosidase